VDLEHRVRIRRIHGPPSDGSLLERQVSSDTGWLQDGIVELDGGRFLGLVALEHETVGDGDGCRHERRLEWVPLPVLVQGE
jgi:hypothetical protein